METISGDIGGHMRRVHNIFVRRICKDVLGQKHVYVLVEASFCCDKDKTKSDTNQTEYYVFKQNQLQH